MRLKSILQQSWVDFRDIPTSVYVLGGAIALLLTWETAQVVKHATGFLPSAPVDSVARIREQYMPNSPYDHSEISCMVDWRGLEEHLYFIEITPEQNAKLTEVEKRAVALIDDILSTYASVTACLNDAQIARLLQPQASVAVPHSLGLDCSSMEHQVVGINSLQQRAQQLKTGEGGKPFNSQDCCDYKRTARVAQALGLMDPTRLLVSLQLLVNDAEFPVTPEQARNILQRYRNYCSKVDSLYCLQDEALHIFSPEQLSVDTGLPPRIAEPSSSPVALRETKKIILLRWQGGVSKC